MSMADVPARGIVALQTRTSTLRPPSIHPKRTGNAVAKNLEDARYQVALANRILANEDVLDAFGHVSMRHPGDPGRYLISWSRSPEVVEPSDILEFTLDSKPVKTPTVGLYAERVIHGE